MIYHTPTFHTSFNSFLHRLTSLIPSHAGSLLLHKRKPNPLLPQGLCTCYFFCLEVFYQALVYPSPSYLLHLTRNITSSEESSLTYLNERSSTPSWLYLFYYSSLFFFFIALILFLKTHYSVFIMISILLNPHYLFHPSAFSSGNH